jgi:hypothetical protein
MDQWEYYNLVITWDGKETWEGIGIDKRLAGKNMPELLNQIGWGGMGVMFCYTRNLQQVELD